MSIATLTGENGILNQATKARETQKNVETEEKIQLEVLGSYSDNGKFDLNKLKENLRNNLGITEIEDIGEGENKKLKFEVDENEIKVNNRGEMSIIDKETGIYQLSSTIDGQKESSENNPIIPKGFKPIDEGEAVWGDGGQVPEKKSVNNGLVIQDEKENEFVWIPVPNIDLMANKIEGKTTDKNGNEYYQGKLYDFNSETGITEKTAYGQETESNREPAYLSGVSYDDNGTYGNLFTEESMQEDYNSMIASVKKYKGFYVGRYEMSLNYASKKGEISANGASIETNRWYGLYKKAKSYYPKDDSNIAVVGSMIWGSQYDRMMIWMSENNINVTSTEPIVGATKNDGEETGIKEEDKLNNIYDLLGNRREWTLEANFSNHRAWRSGKYNGSLPPSYRNGYGSVTYDNGDGSRLVLYIK